MQSPQTPNDTTPEQALVEALIDEQINGLRTIIELYRIQLKLAKQLPVRAA